jgi:hypothetical protein
LAERGTCQLRWAQAPPELENDLTVGTLGPLLAFVVIPANEQDLPQTSELARLS